MPITYAASFLMMKAIIFTLYTGHIDLSIYTFQICTIYIYLVFNGRIVTKHNGTCTIYLSEWCSFLLSDFRWLSDREMETCSYYRISVTNTCGENLFLDWQYVNNGSESCGSLIGNISLICFCSCCCCFCFGTVNQNGHKLYNRISPNR